MNKVFIHCPQLALGSDLFRVDVAEFFRAKGYEVVTGYRINLNAVQSGDILVSYYAVDMSVRAELHGRGAIVIAGRKLTRSKELELAEAYNFKTVDWAAPTTIEEAEQLFATWNTTKVLHKKDYSLGKDGISLVSQGNVKQKHIGTGIFNRIIEESPLIKVEVIYDTVLISWKRASENYMVMFQNVTGKQRELYSPSTNLINRVVAMSKYLTRVEGCFHMAFDFLEENGELKLIEINTNMVSLWWTYYQPNFKDNFLAGLESYMTNLGVS